MTFLHKLLCAFVFCILSLNVFAGGEVPWPLAAQRALSEQSAKGTWYVKIQEKRYLYNIEILRRNQLWIWVRVSILNPRTLDVLSQGEGYFWDALGVDLEKGEELGRKSAGGWSPDPGSYVFMRPVDNVEPGFFVRLVQLEGDKTTKLGISVFENLKPEIPISGIAHQLDTKPMTCPGHPIWKKKGAAGKVAAENAEPGEKEIFCKLEAAFFNGPWEKHMPEFIEGEDVDPQD